MRIKSGIVAVLWLWLLFLLLLFAAWATHYEPGTRVVFVVLTVVSSVFVFLLVQWNPRE
jgi:hypothetical protein